MIIPFIIRCRCCKLLFSQVKGRYRPLPWLLPIRHSLLVSFAIHPLMIPMGFFMMIPLLDALSFVVLHRPSSSKSASSQVAPGFLLWASVASLIISDCWFKLSTFLLS